MDKEVYRSRLIAVLTRSHVGKQNAISMVRLHERVYGVKVGEKINDTRALRELVTKLRNDGWPICSAATCSGGGYYIASIGSEREDYTRNLKNQGIRKLSIAARIEKKALKALLAELQMELPLGEGGS